jgi:hypothetical protein
MPCLILTIPLSQVDIYQEVSDTEDVVSDKIYLAVSCI